MAVDLAAARAFQAGHARLLDRARLALLLGDGGPDAVLAALDGYRNPDGGYGWGLEPDLRCPESQPAGAMHALGVLVEVAEAGGAVPGDVVTGLLDWLAERALPDGGLPFALPIADPAGCAPFWVAADPAESLLIMTAQVAAGAHALARHHPQVAQHPWLAVATDRALADTAALGEDPFAIEVMFVLHLLDALPDRAEVDDLLAHVGHLIPADAPLPVAGGAEGEVLHPLALSPRPGARSRTLFSDATIATDLDRLAALQQPDGGWIVDHDAYSPAARLEWRGDATVTALATLCAHQRA